MNKEGLNGLADILLPATPVNSISWLWVLMLALVVVIALAVWTQTFRGRMWRLRQACRFTQCCGRDVLHRAARELKRAGQQPSQRLEALRFGSLEPTEDDIRNVMKSLHK